MSTAGRKTVLRTIRLTPEQDSLLQKDARARGTSVNALISELITKYATWDRFTEKFGFVQVARRTFGKIVEAVNDERLAMIAKDLGGEMPEAVTSFFFHKLNFETLVATLSLYERYSGLQVHSMETREGECTITFHQQIGQKWLIFLKHFMNEYFKKGLDVAPTTTIVGDSLVLRFRIPEGA